MVPIQSDEFLCAIAAEGPALLICKNDAAFDKNVIANLDSAGE
jgi:hypothetical protein